GAIETALRSLPGVREAAATTHEIAPGDVRLVAYAVPEKEGRFDSDALRAALRRRLSDVMVPSVILPLSALPVTASGKLDRRALTPPREAALEEVGRERGTPRSDLERALERIWAEVLRVRAVDPGKDFFALGGH